METRTRASRVGMRVVKVVCGILFALGLTESVQIVVSSGSLDLSLAALVAGVLVAYVPTVLASRVTDYLDAREYEENPEVSGLQTRCAFTGEMGPDDSVECPAANQEAPFHVYYLSKADGDRPLATVARGPDGPLQDVALTLDDGRHVRIPSRRPIRVETEDIEPAGQYGWNSQTVKRIVGEPVGVFSDVGLGDVEVEAAAIGGDGVHVRGTFVDRGDHLVPEVETETVISNRTYADYLAHCRWRVVRSVAVVLGLIAVPLVV